MRKTAFFLLVIICLTLLFSGCGKPAAQEQPAPQMTSMQASAQETACARAVWLASQFFETGSVSCARLYSYGPYPSYYLEDAASLTAFLKSAEAGTDDELELLFPRADGAVSYQKLSMERGKFYAQFVRCEKDAGGFVKAVSFERFPVLDWTVSDRGNFYYRLFPAGDKHYADYQLIRSSAPDAAYNTALERYILPIDYYYVNLFLLDWSESDFADISFNDLFDRLYALRSGVQPDTTVYSENAQSHIFRIPSDEFERVVLPFFSVSVDTLRALAGYDAETGSYPWREIRTNDMERYDYPAVEPYITDICQNSDGTTTLYVSCLSTDLPTDCIFSHALTVRDLPSGGFQYVSNRITAQTEYGLPNAAPRLDAK